MEFKHKSLTDQIIKAFYAVYNVLGYGFLEKVYENALAIELREMGLKVAQEAPIIVTYRDQEIGYYEADLLVEDAVIVELKATRNFAPEHEAQLLNFGPEPQIKRKAFDNERKSGKPAGAVKEGRG